MSDQNLNTSNGLTRRSRPQYLENTCIFFGELLATAMLMFLGCMGCVQSNLYSNTHLQSSLNFGFVVLICIQCFGCVSGAHMNPTVTLASLVYKMISLPMALAYFVAQMLGAFIGYGLLKALLPSDAIRNADTPLGTCVTSVADDISVWQAVLIEFLVTCALISVCCGVWDPRNAKWQDSVSIRFGLTIVGLSLAGGRFTGSSMNPVRSFAPAIWNNSWEHHWIYWVGPMSAALVTSLVYKHVFRREVNDDGVKSKSEKIEQGQEFQTP